MSGLDQEVLSRALGRVPSGLFVVTVRKEEQSNAFLASWVQQAGFEPPLLSVAVRMGRPAQALLDAGACFAINVLAVGGQALVKHFSRGFAVGEDCYAGLVTERGTTGVEILPEALAVLECKVAGSFRPAGAERPGDHVIYFGEVVGARMREGGGDPSVHIRRSGLTY